MEAKRISQTLLVAVATYLHSQKGEAAEEIVGQPLGLFDSPPLFSGMLVLGFVVAVLGAPYLFDWLGRRFFGMPGKELNGYLFNRLVAGACFSLQVVGSILRLLGLKKTPKVL
ncbi:hypothetical protein JCM13664_14690 [Methylothermus subterraneus]